ncbi:hypothetical protein [Micromonospora yangpuensis]|uniref:Uncharacterized protein n=1 Tax=Micromonospora yangpuensis TaxID=683228 RepID=A0A1C6U4C9_9ACTN|nr:hypothetical protein [Micromonospora yangpuensis]GGL93019.1 hypothetical protein GCM10012279_08430 [Micromonospora yangpuensis]SCL48773.1 hypothetical protein GA0070617_0974 [Micromonospora yangpuensis]
MTFDQVVVRTLARLDDAEPDPDEFPIAVARDTADIVDFVTAGCALIAANLQESLLTDAAHLLRQLQGGEPNHQETDTVGERLRAVRAALAGTRAERDRTRARFRQACAALRRTGALVDVTTGSGPGTSAEPGGTG